MTRKNEQERFMSYITERQTHEIGRFQKIE